MRLTGLAVRRQAARAVCLLTRDLPAALSLAAGCSAQWAVVCCHSTPPSLLSMVHSGRLERGVYSTRTSTALLLSNTSLPVSEVVPA